MSDSDLTAWPQGKVGFIGVVGRPNVGKSTFINAIIHFHLAAVSAVPQTTRRRRLGILTEDDSQLIFIDTPGVHQGTTKLADSMTSSVRRSTVDADLIVCMIDPTRRPGEEDELVTQTIAAAKAETILVINKTDRASDDEKKELRAFYLERMKSGSKTFEICSLDRTGFDELLDYLRGQLPFGPYLYPPDQMTDATERVIAADLIREGILVHLRDELPHCAEVEVVDWQETPKKIKISADIHVERKSQKPIMIGANKSMLKKISNEAVQQLREWYDQRIDLRLFVKVSPNWQNKRTFLKEMGF